MAAVFHDSRRKSPYLDTGHGARAAAYYAEVCREGERQDDGSVEFAQIAAMPACDADVEAAEAAAAEGAPALMYDPRTMLAIAWHDRDDEEGLEAIAQAIANDAAPGADVAPGADGRGFAESLPAGAEADAATIYRIFKDADGLDRVRLGEGGLDVRFLRTDQARNQVEFARSLFAASSELA